MIKIFRKLEDGINNKVIAFETMAMTKKPGDGHYVAIALGLLIALASFDCTCAWRYFHACAWRLQW